MFHVANAFDMRSANACDTEGKSAADGDKTPLSVLSYIGRAAGTGG